MSVAIVRRSREVTVVIPSRDGRRFLERCIPALARTELPDGTKLQIVVVDNGSRDGSPEWLRERAAVEPIILPAPAGFAHANNAARGIARGEVVVFLNNDTEVEPGWLLRPLEILDADDGVGAVGSKLVFLHRFVPVTIRTGGGRAFVAAEHYGTSLDDKARWAGPVSGPQERDGRVGRWASDGSVLYLPIPEPDLDGAIHREPVVCVLAADPDGPIRIETGARDHVVSRFPGLAVVGLDQDRAVRLIQNAGSAVTKEGAGGDVGTGVEDGPEAYGVEEEVPSLCGAALIVRRRALDDAGWFPAYYTMYYEDTDLCLRLRQLGHRLVFCPASRVRHYHTGSSREWSPRFIQHVARSSLLFLARFGEPRLVTRTVRDRARQVASELRSAKGWTPGARWKAAHAARGTLAGMTALPGVLARRSWDVLRGRARPETLLGTPRRPYEARTEARR